MKDQKGNTISIALQKISDQYDSKRKRICVDKFIEFCNRSMKSWLEKNGIKMHSIHNSKKYDVTETFI